MNPNQNLLSRLNQSSFRRQFKLDSQEVEFILNYGMEKVMDDARRFLEEGLPDFHREKPRAPLQSTMGHPARKGMLATGLCCRRCLRDWHHLPADQDMVEREIHQYLGLILDWFHQQNPHHIPPTHQSGQLLETQLALF